MTVIAHDSEFLEDGKTIDLISIGLIREDGAEYYAVNADANWAAISGNRWLCENVVPHLPLTGKGMRKQTPAEGSGSGWVFHLDLTDTRVRPKWVIANEVREFILAADEPELWAWFGAYDFVALCQLWGPAVRRPGGIPMWSHDLKQECDRLGNPQLPQLPGATAHNALDDAREVLYRLKWLREHAA